MRKPTERPGVKQVLARPGDLAAGELPAERVDPVRHQVDRHQRQREAQRRLHGQGQPHGFDRLGYSH